MLGPLNHMEDMGDLPGRRRSVWIRVLGSPAGNPYLGLRSLSRQNLVLSRLIRSIVRAGCRIGLGEPGASEMAH